MLSREDKWHLHFALLMIKRRFGRHAHKVIEESRKL